MTVTVIDLAEHRIDLTEEDTLRYFGGGWGPCEAETPNEEQSQKLREYPALALMLAGGVLCNDALLECDEDSPERYHIVGDPTEGALMIAAAQLGMTRETLEAAMPRLAEIPFESERKRMTTFHSFKGEHLEGWQKTLLDLLDLKPEAQHLIAFTKGAMDGLLEIADRVWVEDQVESLDAGWRQRIEAANEALAKQGMRVLGVACRALDDLPEGKIREEEELFKLERELIFIGLVGMIDPARCRGKGSCTYL
jgi:Ca2+-transporting ATPase